MSTWWYDPFEFSRPSRIFNQRFGLNLPSDDPISPMIPREVSRLLSWPGYVRPWTTETLQKDAGSAVDVDKDKFQVALDVQQFRPNEITVKVTENNTIVVEGKHEERPDEHGFISRQFTRKYILPKDHDINKVQSSLSSDGVLTITAPKISAVKWEQREIPIQQTGQPSKIAEAKAASKPEGTNVHIQQEQKKSEEKNIEIKQEGPACQKPSEEQACQKPVDAPAAEKPAEVPL